MLLQSENPYRPELPKVLKLDREDFEFHIAPSNLQAMGQPENWSVMAYLAADCDLADQLFDDLLEMKAVGSGPGMHVCALFDGPLLTDACFARLRADTPLREDLILRWYDLESNKRDTLTLALRLSAAWPGRHRLVILGGHGNGWQGLLVDRNISGQYWQNATRCQWPKPKQDCDAKLKACLQSAQSTLESYGAMNLALPDPCDILALDACYMGNIEAIAQLTGLADILLVSEDIMPGEGYPYDQILKCLRDNPSITPKQLAGQIVAITAASYLAKPGRTPSITQVALLASALPAFAQAFVELVQALVEFFKEKKVLSALRYAFNDAPRMGQSGNMDIKGFVERLAKHTLPAPIGEHCESVLDCWEKMVIAKAAPRGINAPNGLSIYAPHPEQFDVAYIEQSNQFAHNLGIWAWFLARYYLEELGKESEGHPLIHAIQATVDVRKS